METTIFPYSKIVGWTGLIFFSCFFAAFFFIGFTAEESNFWYITGAIDGLILALTVYFVRRCLVPALKNETALTLDADKLTFHVTDRVIYWKDVVEISFESTRFNRFLTFDLGGEQRNISIGLAWIDGNNRYIYDTVQAYFEESLKEDGQLGYTKDYNL